MGTVREVWKGLCSVGGRWHTKCDRNLLREAGRPDSISSKRVLGLNDILSFLNSSERFFTGKNEKESWKITAPA